MKTAFVVAIAVIVTGCARSDQISEKAKPAILLSGTEGDSIPFPIHPTKRLASSNTSQSGLSLFEITVPPSSAGAPPHSHKFEDEFFYVRAGKPTFMADGVRKTVEPGGFVLLPRNGTHAFWNEHDEKVIMLAGTSNGKFDDFFDTVALEVKTSGAKTPKQMGKILERVGKERGITIRMDLLPPDVASLYGVPTN